MRSKRFVILLLCTSAFFFPRQAFATHSAAADISYVWQGGNSYLFRVTFYRDCSGVSAPAIVNLNLSAPACGQNIGLPLSLITPVGLQVQPICFLGTSTCNGGSVLGFERLVYEAVGTLPVGCSSWTFAYSICCRSCTIQNIVSPCSQSQFFFATLDNAIAPDNSSPVFKNPVLPFWCSDKPACLDLGAIDPDGDSVVYSLVAPLTGPNTTVTWQSGYSASSPIPSSPASTFDNVTGEFCLWPYLQGTYVMAVLASEYRNGVLIGTVQRDMLVNLAPCPCICSPPPFHWAASVTGTTAKLKWTTVANAIRYEVRYREKGTTAWTSKKTAGNYGTKYISGLMPQTDYQWKVRTLCVQSPKIWSAWTKKKAFSTPSPPPGGPADNSLRESHGISGAEAAGLSIHPSPTNDRIYIDSPFNPEEAVEIRVYDGTGRLQLQLMNMLLSDPLDVWLLAPGMYLVDLRQDDRVARGRFLKY